MDGPFELDTQVLGALPVVDHFLSRLGLEALLQAHLPHDDARVKLAPAKAIGVVVRNLVLHREPVYALGEWVAPFDPALLGLDEDEVALLNDDRVGRTLQRLFDADRASLLTRLVLDAVATFGIDTSQLHNDSTSVKFSGVYRGADGTLRASKPTPAITHGHNKEKLAFSSDERSRQGADTPLTCADACALRTTRTPGRCPAAA